MGRRPRSACRSAIWCAGLYVAFGVLAALRERERSGVGQYLDVSLLESGVSLAVWEAGRFFATGEIGRPLGTAHQSEAPYQAVRSADGWLTLGAITPKTWTGLCVALGLEQLEHETRFATSSTRHAHRHQLIPLIEQRTMTMTTTENIERLERVGVPCAPISSYGQVFTDEHLAAREFFWDAPHDAAGAGTTDRLACALVADQSAPRIGRADARRRYARGAA